MKTVFTLLLAFFPLLVFCADSVGKVVALDGTVSAVSGNQATRYLQVDSPVYVGDTVIVAQNSKAELGFTDGSLTILISQTVYRIDDYQYRKPGAKDHYAGQLVEGGFRTLSGSIAKKNPNGYQVQTPNATIAIRGTIFEARFVDDVVFFGCVQGAVSLANSKGTVSIGPSESYSFAVATAQDKAIQPLAVRPLELSLQRFEPPRKGLQLESVHANPKAHPYPPGGRPVMSPSAQTRRQKGISAPGPQISPKTGRIIESAPSKEQIPGISPAEEGSSLESSSC